MNDLQACDHQTAKDFLIDKESMQRELANWLTAGSNERIDYIMDALMVDPKLHFTLITVPNMPVDDKQIISLFNGFAKRNNMESSINFNTQIDLAKYTAEQLSGCKKGKQKIRFGLMPSKPNAEIPAKTASEQCESLAELKKTDKFLCAPSILDSVVYYQTLYSGGSNFHNNRDYQHNVTYIRNYSLAPTYCGKEPYVLSACIVSNGVEVMGSLANRSQVAYTMVG